MKLTMNNSNINQIDFITQNLEHNNAISKAIIGGVANPSVKVISRTQTKQLYILRYASNGMLNIAGVDKDGKCTIRAVFSPTEKENIAEFYGNDWLDKITKIQLYPDGNMLDVNNFIQSIV